MSSSILSFSMFMLPGVTSFPLTAAIMERHPASDVLSVPVFMTLSIPATCA